MTGIHTHLCRAHRCANARARASGSGVWRIHRARVGGRNYAAAEALVAAIEHQRLAGRDGELRRGEFDGEVAAVGRPLRDRRHRHARAPQLNVAEQAAAAERRGRG